MKFLVAKLEKLGYLPEEDKRNNKSKYTAIIKAVYPKYKELAKFYMKLAYIHEFNEKDIALLHKKYLFLRERRIVPDLARYFKDTLKFVQDINKLYEYHTFKREGIILNNHPDFKSMLKNVKFVAIVCLIKNPFVELENRYLTAFDTLKQYGSPAWCISRCAGTFRNYSDNKEAIQYILISKKEFEEYKNFDKYLGNNRLGSNKRFGLTVSQHYQFDRKIWPFRLFQKSDKLICFNDSNDPVRRLSALKRLTRSFPIEKVHNKLSLKFNIDYETERYTRRGIVF